MAALQEDRYSWRREGQVLRISVKAETTIYKGALVCRSSGYAVPAADTSGLRFAGVAMEHADNSAGANGDVMVRVWQTGIFPVYKDNAAAADCGTVACVVDDQTVAAAATTTNDVECGRIVRVLDSDEVEIKIDGYAY